MNSNFNPLNRKKLIRYFSRSVLVVLCVMLVAFAPVQAFAYTNVYDPSEALRFLPPLSSGSTDDDLDRSLADFLMVTVYQKTETGWNPVQEFTSQNSGSERLRLEGNHYHVNWHNSVASSGGEFRIEAAVAGLEIGFIDVNLTQNHNKGDDISTDGIVTLSARGGLPIKFIISDHPSIRARALTEQGYSATDIAQILLNEFGLSDEQAAQLLYNEHHDAPSIGLALNTVYGLGAETIAEILENIGYAATEVAEALKSLYADLTVEQMGQILKDNGYDASEIASALKGVFAISGDDVSELLKTLGFSAIDIASALKSVYTASMQNTAATLWNSGFTANEIAEAEKEVYYALPEDMAQGFRDLGIPIDKIVGALNTAYGWTEEKVVPLLDWLGYDSADIVMALREVFMTPWNTIAEILYDLSHDLVEVIGELAEHLTALEIAQAVKDTGPGWVAIGEALFNTLELSWTTLVAIVIAVWDLTIGEIIKDLGYLIGL